MWPKFLQACFSIHSTAFKVNMDDQIMSWERNFTFVCFNAFTTPQKKGFVSQP